MDLMEVGAGGVRCAYVAVEVLSCVGTSLYNISASGDCPEGGAGWLGLLPVQLSIVM